MEPLQKQIKALTEKFGALSTGVKWALGAALALVVAVAAFAGARNQPEVFEYAYTDLTAEDSAEAQTLLRDRQIPFKVEAAGAALSVPKDKVYDARMQLATAGLPRGSGKFGPGFELFDRGDLGVSEFTQSVNLQRSLEGELSRTIGRFPQVRTARVHITLPKKGLYRDEDQDANAAVVVGLKAGMALNDGQVNGIRHLVSAAVPGLKTDNVTVVDGTGTVLSGSSAPGQSLAARQQQLERELERKLVGILTPAVGEGNVVAKVSLTMDDTEEDETREEVQPGQVRSSRTLEQNNSISNTPNNGPAGAVSNNTANVPMPLDQPPQPPAKNEDKSSVSDKTENFELGKTITQSRRRGPRITRRSVSILVDGINGKERTPDQMKPLSALAKAAVNIDEDNGDQFQIKSVVFTRPPEEGTEETTVATTTPALQPWQIATIVAVLLTIAALLLRRRPKPALDEASLDLLRPGAKVGEIEAALGEGDAASAAAAAALADGTADLPALPDPAAAVRDRARELAQDDPVRAVHLLRAWINADAEEPAKLVEKAVENG